MARSLQMSVLALALAGLGATLPSAAAPPKLVVAISVDQFSAGLFDQYRESFSGGLRRLADGGAVFPNGYQSHAATETCPGHSTLLTGRHPSATGIIANAWRDAKTGESVYCVKDPTVSVPGVPANPRGPANLKVSTLGEWMHSADPASRTVAVSGKDRAAITMAGHDPMGAYWWEDERGFNTYVRAGEDATERLKPVQAFNAALASQWAKAAPRWRPLRPACAALNGTGHYGELTLAARVPPPWQPTDPAKPWREDPAFKAWFHASPGLDRLTLQLALSLVHSYGLGRGPAPDLLAVSLSATDYVGHRYGNQGPEMCDQLAHLDLELGRFLAALDALKLPYVVVLTADHGAVDAAERNALRGIAAHRLTSDLVAEANASVRKSLDLAADPLKGDAQGLYVFPSEHDAALRERIVAAALDFVRQRPEVVAAFPKAEALAAKVPAGKPVDELTLLERFSESVDAERSPDILIALEPYASFGKPRAPENYIAGHGSPWNYDRRVPIVFWGVGVTHTEQYLPIETVDIAPTLAALLGVKTPAVDGRCLDLDPGLADLCAR
jgi:predicted AlkP superfamily pyrophosphatase or phosphodiesterase